MAIDNPLFMGIDAGSSKIRALIFNSKGLLVAQSSEKMPTIYSNLGWAHYDPKELWKITIKVINHSLSLIDNPKRVVSVAVASVGETAIILDKNDQPIYHSIAWVR